MRNARKRGPFRRMVGRIQTWTVEEGEQKRPFVFEMMRQAAIRRIPVVFL